MRYINNINRLRSGVSKVQLIAIVAILACVSQFASAQSASFQISENANLLRASLDLDAGLINQAQFDMVMMKETCQNPSSRLQDRNRPYLSVLNTSADADEITSVVLNMEEAGFEFGNGDMAGDGFSGLLSMLSSKSDDGVVLTSANYLGDTSELQLNFSGLTQGLAAIFRVDIDEPNGIFMFPDYREAFQGANEGNGRNGDLAKLSANFSSGTTRHALFDQESFLTNAGHPERYHSQTMTPPATSRVPEPATMCLLLSGLAGMASLRRRSI